MMQFFYIFYLKIKKNTTLYLEENFHKREKRTRSGTSLSTVFIEADGKTAFITRDGSTSKDKLKEMLKSVGILEIKEIYGGPRKVFPYDVEQHLAEIGQGRWILDHQQEVSARRLLL